MDLFNTSNNLLPYDGEVEYYGLVFNQTSAKEHYHHLLQQIEWRQDEVIMFGKRIITKRKVAWYGDQAFSYTYSNVTRTALPWTEHLLILKEKVEEISKEQYNSCLLNLYHSGDEGMAWHSDDEKELVPSAAIASLSFGATRKFLFKHKKTKFKVDTFLEPGSLLIMKGATQTNWLHQLPKTKKVNTPRINLTFRKMMI